MPVTSHQRPRIASDTLSTAGPQLAPEATCAGSEPLYNVGVVPVEECTVPDANLAATGDGRDFGAAVARFQQFLRQNNCSDHILWLTPEDALLTGKRFIYFRTPVPTANKLRTRSAYDEGMALGRGLVMSTLCEMGSSTCCYLWYPKRKEEVPRGLWPRDRSVKLTRKWKLRGFLASR
jgi:hypothetical protein